MKIEVIGKSIIQIGDTMFRSERITAVGPVQVSTYCEVFFALFGVANEPFKVSFGSFHCQEERRRACEEAETVRDKVISKWFQLMEGQNERTSTSNS